MEGGGEEKEKGKIDRERNKEGRERGRGRREGGKGGRLRAGRKEVPIRPSASASRQRSLTPLSPAGDKTAAVQRIDSNGAGAAAPLAALPLLAASYVLAVR